MTVGIPCCIVLWNVESHRLDALIPTRANICNYRSVIQVLVTTLNWDSFSLIKSSQTRSSSWSNFALLTRLCLLDTFLMTFQWLFLSFSLFQKLSTWQLCTFERACRIQFSAINLSYNRISVKFKQRYSFLLTLCVIEWDFKTSHKPVIAQLSVLKWLSQ